MNRRRLAIALAGWAVLAGATLAHHHFTTRPNPAPASAAPEFVLFEVNQPGQSLKQRGDQILREEMTQRSVATTLGNVARNFRNLIEDLESNGLIKSGQAKDLINAATTLESVGTEHLRKAGEYLHQGRQQPNDADHLKQAHIEIEKAVQKLNTLVQLAG